MKPDFPLVWDNSMRSELVSCPRKFAWHYLDLWSSQYESIDLIAGKAFAAGLEVARRS